MPDTADRDLEYRACLPRSVRRRQVIPVNTGGEGEPSAAIAVVL